MKTRFELSLSGADWWKPFLPFWIVYIAYFIVSQKADKAIEASAGGPWIPLAVTFLFLFILTAASAIFTIVMLRIALPKLKVGEASFSFRGSIGSFLGRVLLGLLLSILTLGIYLPWFIRGMASYLASETRFRGEEPRFLGKPGKLLLINILTLFLPVTLIVVLVVLAFGPGAMTGGAASGAAGAGASTASMLSMLVTFAIVLLVCAPYMYFVYRWYIDFSCDGARLCWKTDFWPSCLLILGQVLLTVVTLGIYWPAAFLKLYRYFAERTVVEREGVELGRLGFDSQGRGFGLLWGQALLCIVTLGFYIPWAYSKVLAWLCEGTSYEDKEEAPAVL